MLQEHGGEAQAQGCSPAHQTPSPCICSRGSPPALIPEGPGYLSPALEACRFCQCPVHRRASWAPAAALAAVLAQVRGRAHQLTRQSRAPAEESCVQTGLAPRAPMCTSVNCMCMCPCTSSHVGVQRCLCPQVARSPTLPQVPALRLEKSPEVPGLPPLPGGPAQGAMRQMGRSKQVYCHPPPTPRHPSLHRS